MANNIEWSHALYLPRDLVDPDDIPSTYEGLDEGEVGVALGSDFANILYGTPEQLLEFAKALTILAEDTIETAEREADRAKHGLQAIGCSCGMADLGAPGHDHD